MPPKPQNRDAFELFQSHVDRLLNPAPELVQRAQKTDWDRFEGGVTLMGMTMGGTAPEQWGDADDGARRNTRGPRACARSAEFVTHEG